MSLLALIALAAPLPFASLEAADRPAPAPPLSPVPTIPRGRDPWVFRCIFEDRTRMVILAPAPDLWIAFNPENCAVQKVWVGKMLFRGKVWDFSQDNCAAEGQILAEAPSIISYLPETADPAPWTAFNARFDSRGHWVFEADNASLTSPTFDLSAWRSVFVAFDETSRAGPFRIDLSDDGGGTWNAQSFFSTTSGSSDTDWQWNFKLLNSRSPHARIRIAQPDVASRKTLRNLRIFGDHAAWTLISGADSFPVIPSWRGYRLDPTSQGCVLLYSLRLPDSREVSIEHEIELTQVPVNRDAVLTERFRISGLPAGARLILGLPTPAVRTTPGAGLTPGKLRDTAEFTTDGPQTLTTVFHTKDRP